MAKATKNPIPPVEPDYTVTLELSSDEAMTVRDVLYKVGGYLYTRRQYTQSVFEALTAILGLPPLKLTNVSGSIKFEEL